MGTRGAYGFRKNGMDKLTYNHMDSYPSYLGKHIVDFCRQTSEEEMNRIFDRIILVEQSATPTKEQIKQCAGYFDDSVASGSPEDWYCLLRRTQGELSFYKMGLNYMINDSEFIYNSLFCEYAYIINLDTHKLEFWKGFQHTPTAGNRYGKEKHDGYYPCAMKMEFDLASLPDDAVDQMQCYDLDYEEGEGA